MAKSALMQGDIGNRTQTEAGPWLASPATVAASALTGKITHPREYWQ